MNAASSRDRHQLADGALKENIALRRHVVLVAATEREYAPMYGFQFSTVRAVSPVSNEMLASFARRDWRRRSVHQMGKRAK